MFLFSANHLLDGTNVMTDLNDIFADNVTYIEFGLVMAISDSKR